MSAEPILPFKADLAPIIKTISLSDSPVGIDAQYTHAIIISLVQQIAVRLDHLEDRLNKWEENIAGK